MGKRISAADAAALVKDGMTIMVGGFLANGTAESIIDALVARGVKDLTMIVNDTGYPDKGSGKLIAHRQVRRVIVSHVGTNPLMADQMDAGTLEVKFCPQGTIAEQTRTESDWANGIIATAALGSPAPKDRPTVVVGG